MAERFHYLFNDPVVKASSLLDPHTWPGDPTSFLGLFTFFKFGEAGKRPWHWLVM